MPISHRSYSRDRSCVSQGVGSGIQQVVRPVDVADRGKDRDVPRKELLDDVSSGPSGGASDGARPGMEEQAYAMARWRDDIRCRSPTAAAACDADIGMRAPRRGEAAVMISAARARAFSFVATMVAVR